MSQPLQAIPRRGMTRVLVLAELRRAPQPVGPRAIWDVLAAQDISYTAIERALATLVRNGEATRIARGAYVATGDR